MTGLLQQGTDFLLSPAVLPWVGAVAKVTFIMTVVMTSGLILSWVERKQSAIMQDRIGANRASILGVRALGLVHNLADGLKGIIKEDFIPPGVNKFLHTLAPFVACFTATACFAVLPFGSEVVVNGIAIPLTIAPMSVSVLFVFALLSIGVYGVVISGYVSHNKYGTLGGLRASAQMISYEVATGLTILGALMMYQTLDFREMVAWQEKHTWGIVYQPVGFILFFAATIVEMKRVPFDLPEAESEIIGYFVEYSGMKFMLFLMAEFIESLLFAWIIVLIFLGGWAVPFYTPPAAGEEGYWLGVALQAFSFTFKVVALCWLQMLIRWTLPRFRYDQIMHLGWKIMLPIALANVAITAVVMLWIK